MSLARELRELTNLKIQEKEDANFLLNYIIQ